MFLTSRRVKIESYGRYLGLYSQYGITVPDNRKHGPCPLCGGTDRFRLDRDYSGFYCNNCGPGDFIRLIKEYTGMDFHETLESIFESVGGIMVKDPENKSYDEDNEKNLKYLWKRSLDLKLGDLVCTYLAARGIDLNENSVKMLGKVIKYSPNCYESSTKVPLPAMICRVVDPSGAGVTLHRTYLSPEGNKQASLEKTKKVMPPVGEISGSAIRLMPPTKDGLIGIAEGIETALSAAKMMRVPTWSVMSANGIASFIPPKDIKTVVIFGDNDTNYVGQKSAYILANRLHEEGKKCEVVLPDLPGTDFNDELKIALVKEIFGEDKK